MRTLKFRAWERDEPFEGIFMPGDDGHFYTTTSGNIGDWHTMDNVIVEQYTGLVDRHGKEIYEGDIAKIQSKPYIPDEYIVEGKPIIFMNGLFSIKKSDYVHIPIYLFFNAENITHDIEVIGNIHENKELLK